MAKKDKKAIEKRRAKSQEKKTQSRTSKSKPGVSVQVISRPPMAEIDAPEGFRPISISQAMMEYTKPLMEYAKSGDIDELNEIMPISMMLWNFTSKVSDRSAEQRSQVVNAMKSKFNMEDNVAEELFDMMIPRKEYLFPEEVQPKFPPTIMFIRKEMSHIVAPFNYSGLNFSPEVIPPDEKDRATIEKINKMDQYIIDRTEYDQWEDFFFSMLEEVQDRYVEWLIAKGAAEHSQRFAYCLDTYLNFIYMYMHDDLTILKTVSPVYFDEFFSDYLLRKLMAEPHVYAMFPPAIQFFYRFLHEKGYLDNPEKIIRIIDKMEPGFIEVLRKRFT